MDKKGTYLLYFLVFMGFVFLVSCRHETTSAEQSDNTAFSDTVVTNNTTVSCYTVHFSTFAVSSSATGLIRTPAQSKLSFRVSGTINTIPVYNGALVSTGQILARLDDRDQQLALRVAKDQLAESRVQLRALIAEYGGTELDTSTIEPNARAFIFTKSGYYKALTALALAHQQLDYTTLKAPFSGVIANLTAKPHNFITSYEPYCTILSRNGLIVEFSVLENELSTVRVGLPVRISPVALPQNNYIGEVSEVNPFVNAQGLVLIKARIRNPDSHLLEGMNTNILIERLIPHQLVVPKSAVMERSGRKVIFTVENLIAKWNYVIVAHENNTQVAISNGLKPGDNVIVSGNLNLGHDAPVRVEK